MYAVHSIHTLQEQIKEALIETNDFSFQNLQLILINILSSVVHLSTNKTHKEQQQPHYER